MTNRYVAFARIHLKIVWKDFFKFSRIIANDIKFQERSISCSENAIHPKLFAIEYLQTPGLEPEKLLLVPIYHKNTTHVSILYCWECNRYSDFSVMEIISIIARNVIPKAPRKDKLEKLKAEITFFLQVDFGKYLKFLLFRIPTHINYDCGVSTVFPFYISVGLGLWNFLR